MIVLQCLFSLKESRDVFFQGGTAIRWFYGGLRFSEDLDFVSSWSSEKTSVMVDSAAEQIRRYLVANFGPGDFFLKQKKPSRLLPGFFGFYPQRNATKDQR